MSNTLENPTVDPVQLAENAAVDGREIEATGEGPKARMLTPEEWAQVMPPFYYIQVNFDQWTNLEYDIAVKYIMKNGTGWVYFSDKRFIFEKEDDYILFRMWASEKPMMDDKLNLNVV